MSTSTVIIHPTASVSNEAIIGLGTRIWNQAQIRENSHIGKNCIIGKDVYIDFDVELGDNVKVQNSALLYHGVILESGVFVGPGVIFTNDKKPRAINPDGSLKGNDDWEVGKTLVCYGASIGAGAIILPGITIGSFALVGSGAVVTHDVPAHALVIGQPARKVGYVCKCATNLIEDDKDQFHCPSCGERFSPGQLFEAAK